MAMVHSRPFHLLSLLAGLILLLVAIAAPPVARGQATFTVTNLDDSGAGSLRAAIIASNGATPAASTTNTISFQAGLNGTITLETALPSITQPVVIDASTVSGADCASDTQVAITLDGVNLADPDPQNLVRGIDIQSPDVTVRGLAIVRFGNGVIARGADATLTCNRIGETASGDEGTNRGAGIFADQLNFRLGGPNAGDGNRIRYNGLPTSPGAGGVAIFSSAFLVQQNIIADNTGNGLLIGFSGAGDVQDNLIGSLSANPDSALGAVGNNGNLGSGIRVGDTSNLNISGNVIVNSSDAGIHLVDNASSITISDNLISANSVNGIKVTGNSTDVVITGNRIGTNAAGEQTIGVLQGNENEGILLDGTPPLPNGGPVPAQTTVSGVTIGGTDQGEANIIAYNTGPGVRVLNASDNVIVGNTISANLGGGVVIAGTEVLGNTILGGGVVVAGGNALGNTITQNSIFGHATLDPAQLGIDLGADGRTANDADDSDSGPNNLQNFPVFTSATLTDGVFTGNLGASGFATGSYTLEIFKADAGEGRTYLGRNESVAHNAGSFTVSGVGGLLEGESIVATATDASGNTSEFSDPVTVAVTDPAIAVEVGDAAVSNGGERSVGSTLQGTNKTTTITIRNAGTATLTLSQPTLNNTDGSAFSQTIPGDFATSLAPDASTSFEVQLSGATIGSFAATVSIGNNAVGADPFSFSLTGSVTAEPEPGIAVAVGGNAVVSGQATPVSFSAATVGAVGELKTFTVTNNGQADLELGTVTVNPAAGFTVVTQPDATVAAGESTSFQIRLNTASAGNVSGTVSFTTNVTGQSPFSFPVSGTVTEPTEEEFRIYLPLVVRPSTP